ncbi:MAG: LOG family protein [Planctomycetota bacterium]
MSENDSSPGSTSPTMTNGLNGRRVHCTDPQQTFHVIEEAVLGLWNVVDDLSSVYPPKPDYYRVTIFGSARIRPGDVLYEDVRRLAAALANIGCDIVTGGGPGLMQAANEGEKIGDVENLTRSIGLRVELAFEQAPNPFLEKLYRHRTFFSRLHHFVRLSSAFVVVPGGIGTTLELMLIWQLLQVRHVADTPLVLVGPMWKDLVEWARSHMLGGSVSLVDPKDVGIPICVNNVDEAIAILTEHKRRWDASLASGPC